jgi:cyclin B
MTKINPFNHKKNNIIYNNVSGKRKYYIPSSTREFGKEINISSNLTTYSNQETYNGRRSVHLPAGQKPKKELQNIKIKNYEQLALRKKKKDGVNSFQKKKNNSFVQCYCSNRASREKIKRGLNGSKSKNISQKNIFGTNHTISINDDVIMKDENFNPNITNRIKPKMNSTKRAVSNININRINQINSTINLNEDNDIEMKIENISYHEIKPKKEKKIDVQNADEYFDDICQELFSNEDKYLVDPKYMSNQSDINHRMRAILIDWLIDVHLKYKLVPQTMYIAVNLIDRYLEKNETNRAKLQLVGVTAMFIACKYEEIYPPDLKDFVYITDGAYVKQDVLDMEYKMLKSLEFNITFPTQWSIFEIYKKKLDLDDKTFKLAWFLMELCLIDYKILKFKMSYIAASAILIAIKTLGIYRSDFSSVIGIEENQLEECCKEIYNYYVYNSTHNLQAIRKKFAMTRYNEVSKIKLC